MSTQEHPLNQLPIVLFQGALVLFPVTKLAQLQVDGLDVNNVLIDELRGYEPAIAALFHQLADTIAVEASPDNPEAYCHFCRKVHAKDLPAWRCRGAEGDKIV